MLTRAMTVVWRVRAWLALRRAREHSMNTLASSHPTRILVVCHGNIYRSAFVGEYLRARVHGDVIVRSTGFHRQSGRRSPRRHVTMALDRGVDLSRHESSVIEPADLEWAEIVVLMDRSNWVGLRRIRVEPSKLVWLGALTPGTVEIDDPYRMDDTAASRLIDRLAQCTEGLAERLNRNRQIG